MRAVLLFAVRSMLARASTNSRTTSIWPFSDALMRAVLCFESVSSMSALARRSNLTTSTLPLEDSPVSSSATSFCECIGGKPQHQLKVAWSLQLTGIMQLAAVLEELLQAHRKVVKPAKMVLKAFPSPDIRELPYIHRGQLFP